MKMIVLSLRALKFKTAVKFSLKFYLKNRVER